MWNLISWLHRKPVDLDLQCFQIKIKLGTAGQRLRIFKIVTIQSDKGKYSNISNSFSFVF